MATPGGEWQVYPQPPSVSKEPKKHVSNEAVNQVVVNQGSNFDFGKQLAQQKEANVAKQQ